MERDWFYRRYKNEFTYNIGENFEIPYALYDKVSINQKLVHKIHRASNELYKLYDKVYKHMISLSPSELVELGYPSEFIRYMKISYGLNPTYIGRFDFVVDFETSDVKMIEFNAETPFMVVETFKMNKIMAEHFRKKDANVFAQGFLKSALADSFSEAALHVKKESHQALVVFAGHFEDIEEYNTVKTLMDFSPIRKDKKLLEDIKTLTVYPHQNGLIEPGLYTKDMRKIDILYRPGHPTEFLLDDKSEDGENVGLMILELVRKGHLAIVNPPSAFVIQSKVILSVIYELYENGKLFSSEERSTIAEFMLPTYRAATVFKSKNMPYVSKPTFSREGSSVTIHDGTGALMHASKENYYDDFNRIYQQYVELPRATFAKDKKLRNKAFIIGAFVLNGDAAGLSMRIGDEITESDCRWMPLVID